MFKNGPFFKNGLFFQLTTYFDRVLGTRNEKSIAPGLTVRSRTNGVQFLFLVQAFSVKFPFVREQVATK